MGTCNFMKKHNAFCFESCSAVFSMFHSIVPHWWSHLYEGTQQEECFFYPRMSLFVVVIFKDFRQQSGKCPKAILVHKRIHSFSPFKERWDIEHKKTIYKSLNIKPFFWGSSEVTARVACLIAFWISVCLSRPIYYYTTKFIWHPNGSTTF